MHITRRRRRRQGLAALRDENDLPDPEADYTDGTFTPAVNEKAVAHRKAVEEGDVEARAPLRTGSKKDVVTLTIPKDVGDSYEQVVLTDAQEAKLRRVQNAFRMSQTWYRRACREHGQPDMPGGLMTRRSQHMRRRLTTPSRFDTPLPSAC
jgi:hypothetical protein